MFVVLYGTFSLGVGNCDICFVCLDFGIRFEVNWLFWN